MKRTTAAGAAPQPDTTPMDAAQPQPSENEPEPELPGADDLREAVSKSTERPTDRGPKLRDDAVAGLTVAIANVPDRMANGLLLGVNPVHGLCATMAGSMAGGLCRARV